MLGAITGDIIGSVYESSRIKPEFDFPFFVEESEFTDSKLKFMPVTAPASITIPLKKLLI